ncbi:MAG TPA: ATP-dependent protease LonB [Syntrophothermus lipocalidus]|uniref:endopeptidase La n=1 Tax=Syntrophothermus lipocalidus (strain DSM 12680 / TGB-C1) TaxID=643648 RepID=D7CJY4_SYNLT|nr:ATP-dependent protease LonB [Syntrophothermus lipocalidus]ADI01098.1 Sigma 54 interacting domain protein [Syntrophothermus lipocalidus DSM 12680]HHV77964.1 ATP-dependent protease LonB [Syntrophothermus lipocalidus]HOV42532.1 ATP-dependent protease LonB [Syntrophothermus lipocalidus]
MSELGGFFYLIQVFFGIVIGLYFWHLLRRERGTKAAVFRDSEKEREKLRRLRGISLTEPLSSKTRPSRFEEIVGQEEGIEALKAALCGPNPQHVIIYGPPGVGKTAAARLVLEYAKADPLSPFGGQARFVEIDATITRFDERNIADPLIGSVHDPIYQGAGSLGLAGIPQPKPGAVTKAHGGILFIDEIGELHPTHLNKLLKVLEERKVYLESAYYSQEDKNIPSYIHDIFQNGLPADFRLVGATTKSPEELPAALRSRCMEIFFRPLERDEIQLIARRAAEKIGCAIDEDALAEVARYATNGREAVNIIQLAAGIATVKGASRIDREILARVVNHGRFNPRYEVRPSPTPRVGVVNALAVHGANQGRLIEVEVCAMKARPGQGRWKVTGVIEEEEFGDSGHAFRRKSMAKGAVENVMTALRWVYGLKTGDYDIHINFPGGMAVDGPSAGVAMAVAVFSALKQWPVRAYVAMTGEISVAGNVKPVGGVIPKIEAARRAGVKQVFIPQENWLEIFEHWEDIEVVPVESIAQVIENAVLVDVSRDSIVSGYPRTLVNC